MKTRLMKPRATRIIATRIGARRIAATRLAAVLTVLGCCLVAHAADEPSAAPAGGAAEGAKSPRPRAVPVGAAHPEPADDGAAGKAPEAAPVKFSTTDKWIVAGYNNNELVYTIIVSNEDTRIIHCTALMQGWYFENGKKLPISDRQSTTVFPNQPTQVGNWMDMDQPSGTTYTVKCRPS